MVILQACTNEDNQNPIVIGSCVSGLAATQGLSKKLDHSNLILIGHAWLPMVVT